MFSQDLQHCKFSTNWKLVKKVLNIFEDRITLMSMLKDIDWENFSTKELRPNSEKVKNYAQRFPRGQRSFFSPGNEDKRCGTHTHKLDGKWKSTADVMVVFIVKMLRNCRTGSKTRKVVNVRDS